jgi:uncharacterized beta-barrel protein YwiB (DUF1934 family)
MTKAMERKVWLSIVGQSGDDPDHIDKMEFVTEGNIYREQGASCLTYDESDVSGMPGTKTTVKVAKDEGKVSVIRLGSVNSIMEFEAGKRLQTMYKTPYGNIPMGVFTKGLQVDYDDQMEPVKINLDYAVDLEGFGDSDHSLNIEVKDRM